MPTPVFNTRRQFRCPVHMEVLDEQGKEQKFTFTATFRALPISEMQAPENADRPLLDVVLIGLEGLPIYDGERELSGDELLDAAKDDYEVSMALSRAYREARSKNSRSSS